MNRRRTIARILGFAFGFSLWAGSRKVFGVREPWDASFWGFCAIVAASGAICAIVASPRRPSDKFHWPAAFLAGEVGYMATQPESWSLWPLSLIALSIGALPAVAGVAGVHRFLVANDAESLREPK